MTGFSLGTVWEETVAFVRQESGLLLPVALAIFGPAQILMGIAMSGATKGGNVVPAAAGAQILFLLPAALLVLFGNIAIAKIVLSPGVSVGESLSTAGRAFGRAIGVVALLSLAFVVLALAIVIVFTLGAVMIGTDPRAIAAQLAVVMIIPMVILVVRMLLLAPVLAMEPRGPVDAIRRIWALGAQNFIRFAAVWLLAMFLGIVIAMIEQFVVGSVVGLLKLAAGESELLTAFQLIVNAAIESVLSLGMAVYLALVYRKLD